LVALSVLVAFLFLAMGILDHARSRVMARIGAAMQDKLDRRVFAASMKRLTLVPTDQVGLAAQRRALPVEHAVHQGHVCFKAVGFGPGPDGLAVVVEQLFALRRGHCLILFLRG
jgi:hypothetical protein